jgi:competence protein ComEC
VVRAAGLVLLTIVARAAGRRPDALRSLGLLFWLNVLWRPECVLDTGVRLSYLAAGGIVAGQRLLGRTAAELGPRRRAVLGAAAVTVSAQLATLPQVARSFGQLPLAGPLANLLTVPLFGVVVLLLAQGLVLSLVWPWAGQGLLAVAWLLLRPLTAATCGLAGLLDGWNLGLADWSSGRLLAYWSLVWALGCLTVRRGRGRWSAVVLCYLACLALAVAPTPRRGSVQAWRFAVGQGDCALLRLPDGWSCLIDTGPGWRTGSGPLERDVLPFLKRIGVRRLDAVVLTHGHDDHTGGAAALAGAVPVGRWYAGGRAAAPGVSALRPLAGDTLHAAGDWSLVCLYPPVDLALTDENDQSVVLGLCRGDSLRALWSGDLEGPGEAVLLPVLPPVPARGCDLWKAGHHGSSTSGSGDLLEVLRPGAILISCGVANRHEHPSHGPYVARAETLTTLRTDLQGTIRVQWDGDGRCRIVPQRAGVP